MATSTSFPAIPPSGGLRWTPEAGQKALEKRAFIRVGGTNASRRFLSGAERSWAKTEPAEHDTIFNVQYRITGTPDDIRTALSRAGVAQAEIERAIADSITSTNYLTTKADEYKLERDAHQSSKIEKTDAQAYDWAKVLVFCAQNIKLATVGRKSGDHQAPKAAPAQTRTGETLTEKIAKLGADKVIDVSDMDVMTGKAVRTRPRPRGEKNKSGKYGDSNGRIPFISNNIEKYIGALRWAYGQAAETTYAVEIADVRAKIQAGGAVAAPAASVSTLPSATQSKAAVKVPAPPKASAPPKAKPAQALPPAIKTPPSRVATTGAASYPAIPPIRGVAK